ncbi:MAG: SCO family protein [Pseudomonadales bacterium]
MTTTRRKIHFTIIGIVIFMTLMVSMFVNRMLTPRILHDGEMKVNGTWVLSKPRVIKPFELVSQDNKPFTLENLKGKWSVVFFGFTYCPDVCPTTLTTLKKWKGFMADSEFLADTQVILVTVDPGRDTPEVLAPYLAFFDPEFIGVTGDFMELQGLATNLNAAFSKVPGGGDNYMVDHTANVALINPYGHYHAFFKAPADAGKMKLTYNSIRRTFEY